MTTQELKNQIARYVFGDVMLDAFQAWFIPEAMGDAGADHEGSLLVSEVTLRLAEYTSGHLAEEELRASLRGALYGWVLARQAPATYVPDESTQHVAVITGTSSEGTETQFSLALQTTAWAGTGLSKVPA